MKSAVRWAGSLLLIALAMLAGWRVVATTMADRSAQDDPVRALHWDADHPGALLALAQQQLAQRRPQEAAVTATRLLQAEPLQGRAFQILAAAAAMQGDTAKARALYTIAVRRAPRDVPSRAWLAEALLREGKSAAALVQLDAILRTAPAKGSVLLPLLAQLAEAPDFATALAATLADKPGWRDGMLSTLLEQGSPHAADAVLESLQGRGGLSQAETAGWLERLGRDGRWGAAYGRWAGLLSLAPGAVLPAVYNGGFETEPSGIGFDWRITRKPGVITERERGAGVTGAFAAHLGFAGRRVAEGNLEQTVLLAPGRQQLTFRARAESLRSDLGLEWVVSCVGGAQPLASSERLARSFDWKRFEVDFLVPTADCPAQRLWLRNPVAAGSAQQVSGEIWFDDFAIRAVPTADQPHHEPLLRRSVPDL